MCNADRDRERNKQKGKRKRETREKANIVRAFEITFSCRSISFCVFDSLLSQGKEAKVSREIKSTSLVWKIA